MKLKILIWKYLFKVFNTIFYHLIISKVPSTSLLLQVYKMVKFDTLGEFGKIF